MSLAAKVAASRKQAKKQAEELKAENDVKSFNNRYIAKTIWQAKQESKTAFPSEEIETLQTIALKVVAEHF